MFADCFEVPGMPRSSAPRPTRPPYNDFYTQAASESDKYRATLCMDDVRKVSGAAEQARAGYFRNHFQNKALWHEKPVAGQF